MLPVHTEQRHQLRCKSCHLQLKADKTKAMLVASRSNVAKLINVSVSSTSISQWYVTSAFICSMNCPWTVHSESRHYHLHCLLQIYRYTGNVGGIGGLVLAMRMSRTDYCNSALASQPQTSDALLWQVHNDSTHLVLQLDCYYLRQAQYVIIVVCLSVCLSVC